MNNHKGNHHNEKLHKRNPRKALQVHKEQDRGPRQAKGIKGMTSRPSCPTGARKAF